MNNIAQIKLLEEKIVEHKFDITALQQDLKEENEKIKKVNKHNPNP